MEKQLCILFFFYWKKGRVTTWQHVLENTQADICQISCSQRWRWIAHLWLWPAQLKKWRQTNLIREKKSSYQLESFSISWALSDDCRALLNHTLCVQKHVCLSVRQCLIHLCRARALSTGLDMRALTVLQCTTPFKRQHSASPVCHKACTGSLPRATRQADPG